MYDPTKNYGTGLPLGQELPIIEAGCNLHDAMEDDRVTEAQLRKDLEEFPRFVVDMLIDGLQALNRKNFTSYDTYIINIYHLKNWTTLAKLSDLKHNSATLPPGSLKDKYALSEYILTH
jgi:hypothetical protein